MGREPGRLHSTELQSQTWLISSFPEDHWLAIGSGGLMATHSSTLAWKMPGISHGWRSLVGCSPWSWEELDTTEWLYFHFSLSCTREGNGNPLQCSCLENPRDGETWWAPVYGVAQSQTWLKRRSSSSSSDCLNYECHYIREAIMRDVTSFSNV